MAERICAHEGCNRPHYGHGWCRMHYLRWKRHGDPGKVIARAEQDRPDVLARFQRRLDVRADGCWLWTGALDRDGYGRFAVGRRTGPAHRWSYEHHVGAIPTGLEIDHLCAARSCVRPDHLEPVSSSVNLARRRRERMSAAATAREAARRATVTA